MIARAFTWLVLGGFVLLSVVSIFVSAGFCFGFLIIEQPPPRNGWHRQNCDGGWAYFEAGVEQTTYRKDDR